MATREVSNGDRTVERWTNEVAPGYYTGNPLTKQRDLTASEAADLAAMDSANAAANNRGTLEGKALQALTANATDVNQDSNIIIQANNLAGTAGTRTTAQLSGDVRALAQAVSTLAQNDTNSKKELNALIRLLLNRLDDVTGT